MGSERDYAVLQRVAEGGSVDYGIWPDLLPRLIGRLDKIAHEFPISAMEVSSTQLSAAHPMQPQVFEPNSPPLASQKTNISSQSTDKENDPPSSLHQVDSQIENFESSLPPPMISLINSITQTLTTYFSRYPPHTIQRLSELILTPKEHYRTLPSYLHAVDRVVHVTSGANVYPLPAASQDTNALSNGVNKELNIESISWGTTAHHLPSFGSDESLGGALLTPIPWLRSQNQESTTDGSGGSQKQEFEGEVKTESTKTIDGPNGAGRVETVSVSVNGIPSVTVSLTGGKDNRGSLRAEGGVTQGELLRQEQRAGVVPAVQLTIIHGSGDSEGPTGDDDEIPHARGPEEIGVEDMGPQVAGSVGIGVQGIDVEAAVGRKSDGSIEYETLEGASPPTTPKREASDEIESDSKRVKDDLVIENRHCTEDEKVAMVDIYERAASL